MRTVALETTEKAGTIALLDGPRLITQRSLDPQQGTAQSLAPSLQLLLKESDWRPRDVQLVAVAAGPGSFTGLRIGVTTAKTFAYCVGAELLGVNTLEAIAAAVPEHCTPLWVAMDAQRREVFAAHFEQLQGRWHLRRPTEILSQGELLELAEPDHWLAGPVVTTWQSEMLENLCSVDTAFCKPRAEYVGRLAIEQFASGRREDVWKLVPQYFRKSAAEEKAAKKH